MSSFDKSFTSVKDKFQPGHQRQITTQELQPDHKILKTTSVETTRNQTPEMATMPVPVMTFIKTP